MEAPILIPPDDAPVFNPNLGGVIESPAAFALLTGRYEDLKTSSFTKIHIPITTLPAVLGRTHPSSDSNTYDMGNCKQLSRKHAVIYYCDSHGNTVESISNSTIMNQAANEIRVDSELVCKPSMSDSDLNLIRDENVEVPPLGCYVIKCLSKNKIHVNGKRVEQGQCALLTQGAKIKMLTYTLYFLLPLTSESPKVLSLPHPMQASSSGGNHDDESIMSGSMSVEPSAKKRKTDTSSDFSDRPLSDLLREFFDAVDSNSFERKHSFISTAILSHAINDACADPKLIDKCKNEGGLQRAEVIEWIENHEMYGRYVRGVLKHLEVRTYHQNLSRAMSKVGFERVGSSGRHVKWLIPGVKVDGKKEASKPIALSKMRDVEQGKDMVDDKNVGESSLMQTDSSKPIALSKDDVSMRDVEQGKDMADDNNVGESSLMQTDSSKLSAQATENIEMQRSPEKNFPVTAEQKDSPPDQSTKDGAISDQTAGLKQQDPSTNTESQSGQQPNQKHDDP